MTRLEHVTLVATDFERSVAFYDAVLGALGLARVAELVDEEEDDSQVEAVGWGAPGAEGIVWLVVQGTPTRGAHLRLRANSRAQVEAFHAVGVAHEARSVRAPRRWAIYRRGEFSAMLEDPDGNVIEAAGEE
jgi:catechol 2,3-dioxygenase-like lactoylglutathione lyase family enzyme